MLAPDFNTSIKKYVEETTATSDDVIYALLTGIIEEKHEKILLYLPKVISDILS